MHELSIARDLIDLAAEHAARAGASRVIRIRLRLGALAGVVPPALRTAFEAAKVGTSAAGATLDVQEVRAAIYCTRCEAERQLQTAQSRRCPVCGTPEEALVAGAELELVEIEVR